MSSDPVQKDEINRKAFEKFRKEHTSVPPSIDNATPSERFDGKSYLTFENVVNFLIDNLISIFTLNGCFLDYQLMDKRITRL